MKRVLIVYWSATGNTEAMARAVAEGVRAAGGTAQVQAVARTEVAELSDYDALALGCPSMGDEVLDEDEMEPFVASITGAQVGDKPLALFGSYDWGDGQWMRDWQQRMEGLGARLVVRDLICQLDPDAPVLDACRKAGAALVG
jgi:flavodoxin I